MLTLVLNNENKGSDFMCKTKMRACLCAVVLVAVVFGVWYYIANVRSASTPNGTLVKDMKNIKNDVEVVSRNIVQEVKKAGDNFYQEVKKDSQELVQETKDAGKEAYQNMKQTGKEIAEATAGALDGFSDCFLEKDEETNV